jgi:CRISPR-associated protein (TIGR02710 family)
MNAPKCLLISVGGTAEPVAYSIDQHQPENVIFFASPDSRKEIEEKVRPKTTHKWKDQEIITTADPQDLTACIEALNEALPKKLRDLKVETESLIVDYTGGTKTMSAALVLATIELPVKYSYIGGRVRSKEGLGVVLDGTEAKMVFPNPWDILAIESEKRLVRQFNALRFIEAADTATKAASQVSDRLKPLYRVYKHLCEGYHYWNDFDYKQALDRLNRSRRELSPYAAGANKPVLVSLSKRVEADIALLEQILNLHQKLRGKEGPTSKEIQGLRLIVIDLVANSLRTCRIAKRPDDGVARLYSALEKFAKFCLMEFGIDNSRTQIEQIPESLREEYTKRYQVREGNYLQYGLLASYRLLNELKHPVGNHYQTRQTELENILDIRNHSLMAHGWNPIDSEVFEKLLKVTLEFLEIREDEIPTFPELGALH